jgi:Flp pilus assembly protein TadG
MASLAVDLGQLYTVRNELQNTADAAALAAAGNLIRDQGGEAVRDAAAAHQAAMTVAQRQSELAGQPAVGEEDRNDLTLTFGEWNIYTGNPDTAWTDLGSTCGSFSNANAVRVNLRRASGLAYGPVTNIFAGILGLPTTTVAATATAYLGYTDSTEAGSVTLPLALPDSVLADAQTGKTKWWAGLFSPSAARASAINDVTFKDLGSDTFYQNQLTKPQFDTLKAYLFLVNKGDAVPDTVVNNIKKTYASGKAVRPMARGTQLYPISEYQWAGNIKTIFKTLKTAYDHNKNSQDRWRVCVPVYSPSNPVAENLRRGLMYLARLMSPVTAGHACFNFWQQSYPGGDVPIYVNGFANVDITGVQYDNQCDDCSPYSPAKDHKKYQSTLDCMVKSSLSCRNNNWIDVEVPVDTSTVSPPGSSSGGPENHTINPGAPGKVGALAAIPRLVK